MYTFDNINDITGFANGDRFTTPEQVRQYFTREAMIEAFGPHCEESAIPTQETLNSMAELVIVKQWNCFFSTDDLPADLMSEEAIKAANSIMPFIIHGVTDRKLNEVRNRIAKMFDKFKNNE
jgi:hypothetical protein